MLRHAVSQSTRKISSVCVARRSYSAAKGGAKRALNKQQLQGQKPKPDKPSSPSPPPAGGGSSTTTSAPPPPAGGAKTSTTRTTTTPPPPPPPPAAAAPSAGGGGGDNTPLIMGVALLGAGGAAYYYYSTQQSEEVATPAAPEPVKEKKDKKEKAPEPAKEEVVEAKSEEAASAPPKEEETNPTSVRDEDGSNHVLQIEVPTSEGTESPPPPAAAPAEEAESHPEGGNRVTMESFGGKSTTATVSEDPVPVITSTAKDSIRELQSSIELETSEVTKRANEEVMRSFDASLFEGLDDMTPAQLKTRVIQLATEMKERTRWEALRLKEFLAMKEKETADRYLEVLQQQRLEFEGTLQKRLLEQEHNMTIDANRKLQKKDGDVKDMIDAAIDKLGEEHENEKKAMLDRVEQETKAKYEQIFSQNLEEFKRSTVDEMERKVQALDALSKKLKDLEDALASTQNMQEGSLQAHRVSAAALALAEKMESNKGAGAELNALKSVAGRDNVIAAALSSVPSSITKGVPTLSELQARFEDVAGKSRQAAMVPAGLSGLEGQLAGMVFATLKFPPKPDDPPPEDGSSAADYILVRAKKHVQYGELEKAVQELEKLDGQAAFTVQGWKKDATDRVAVEQALKVIKMECALLNESMSKAP